MYPPQQNNFFAWLLFVDLEEWKRNRYKTEKTGSKHIWKEIPSKPNFLLLKQQKLLSVLQFNTKTEYKPQVWLNKKLLKQLYTTLSVSRIVNKAKIKSRDKNPKHTKCSTLLNSFWKTPQWWPLQALLHWKKSHNRTSHRATLRPLFFQCCQVIALVHSHCVIKFIPWAIGTDGFLCNWVIANILVFGPAKSICSSLWKDCIFKLKKKSSLKTAFVPKSWKIGKLNCKIWLFVPTLNFGSQVSSKIVTVLVVFTFIPLLTFILSQEKKQKGLFCLVLVFGLKNRCTTSVWLPFYDSWKEILHNCSKGFSQKPMILHNRSVGFASWFQQSSNASLAHLKKLNQIKPKQI